MPIQGVTLTSLMTHVDDRGTFTEIYRESWGLEVEPIQWNVVTSETGVMRGVHVHPVHDDYLVVVAGRAAIGLRDLRRASATWGQTAMIDLSGSALGSIAIPHGVAHGFLFHEPSIHVYSVSRYWDTSDELGCAWNDPELQLRWPFEPSKVSERDAAAQSFKNLLAEIEPHQPFG